MRGRDRGGGWDTLGSSRRGNSFGKNNGGTLWSGRGGTLWSSRGYGKRCGRSSGRAAGRGHGNTSMGHKGREGGGATVGIGCGRGPAE